MEDIDKTERRRQAKLAKKLKLKAEKEAGMTERQKLRLATKEKKFQPKLSKDDRKRKYQEQLIDKPREQEAARHLICLNCKKKGHMLKDCPLGVVPTKVDDSKAITSNEICKPIIDIKRQICYNCGKYDHALRTCKLPRNPNGILPFATCFICKQSGHISRDCKENPNGCYPNGGCCLVCSSKYHFAKDCPDKVNLPKPTSDNMNTILHISNHSTNKSDDVEENEPMESSSSSKSHKKSKKQKVERYGGDDEVDDFDVPLEDTKEEEVEFADIQSEFNKPMKKKKSKKD